MEGGRTTTEREIFSEEGNFECASDPPSTSFLKRMVALGWGKHGNMRGGERSRKRFDSDLRKKISPWKKKEEEEGTQEGGNRGWGTSCFCGSGDLVE